MNGSLNSTDTFLVTYTTGDPRLSASDTNQPYRVTLLSTGYSADPEQTQAVAIYRVRAVVRLIPRKLADEPTDWPTVTATTRSNKPNYTVYQWTPGYFTMNVPAQIQGPVRVQTYLGMNLDLDYNWCNSPSTSDIRDAYHTGLEGMRVATNLDYRPFNGKNRLCNNISSTIMTVSAR